MKKPELVFVAGCYKIISSNKDFKSNTESLPGIVSKIKL